MREIKFRGYYNGDGIAGQEPRWLHGDLCHFCDLQIREPGDCPQPVLPDTVGQYAGLKDRDCNEIYEGDILANTRRDDIVRVVWCADCGGWFLSDIGDTAFPERPLTLYALNISKLHVLGNTHDNPELLNPNRQ